MTSIRCSTPLRMTFTPHSSFFSLRTLNCHSFCQSFNNPTTTCKIWVWHEIQICSVWRDSYHNQDSNHYCNALYPIDRRLASRERHSEILKESECQRDNRCDRQQDLDMKRMKIMLNQCRMIRTTQRTLSFSTSHSRILVARCRKSACTDDEHNQIIARKLSLLAAVLTSTIIEQKVSRIALHMYVP